MTGVEESLLSVAEEEDASCEEVSRSAIDEEEEDEEVDVFVSYCFAAARVADTSKSINNFGINCISNTLTIPKTYKGETQSTHSKHKHE